MLDPDRSPSLPSGLTIAKLTVFLGSLLGTTAKSLSAPTMWTCKKQAEFNLLVERPTYKSCQSLSPKLGKEQMLDEEILLHFQSDSDWNVHNNKIMVLP